MPTPTNLSAIRLTGSSSMPRRVDLGEEAVGAEALVDGGLGEEPLEGREVDGVRGHAGDDQRRAAGAGPDAAGMAAGAVEEDAVDPHVVAERGADRARVAQLGRQVGGVLVEEAEGGPALVLAALGHQVAEERRHRLPHGVGDAEVAVAAGRAVLELRHRVGEGLGRVAGEPPGEVAGGGEADEEAPQAHHTTARPRRSRKPRVVVSHRLPPSSVAMSARTAARRNGPAAKPARRRARARLERRRGRRSA